MKYKVTKNKQGNNILSNPQAQIFLRRGNQWVPHGWWKASKIKTCVNLASYDFTKVVGCQFTWPNDSWFINFAIEESKNIFSNW